MLVAHRSGIQVGRFSLRTEFGKNTFIATDGFDAVLIISVVDRRVSDLDCDLVPRAVFVGHWALAEILE